jgi:hypothetical protein
VFKGAEVVQFSLTDEVAQTTEIVRKNLAAQERDDDATCR